jgi:two-component system sensor histidine kinase QseC
MASRSIQTRLLTLGLAVVLVVGAATAWLGYRRAVHEVDELMDAQLAQYARIMLALAYTSSDEEVEFPSIHGHSYQSRILFQIWEQGPGVSRLILTSPGVTHDWPTQVGRNGYSIARIGDRSWRCFAARDSKGEHLIWTGLDLHIRDELARDIAFNNIKPYALGLPILAVLLIVTIQRGLMPLHKMEKELSNRSPDRLDPLPEDDAPSELRPLRRTMNALFGRVKQALDNERRFTSDAAHELRTPLSALRVQLQVAQRAQNDDERQGAISKALLGAERMTHLVGQLLSLARLDSIAASVGHRTFDLSALTEEAIQQATPAADAKQCRISSHVDPELVVQGNPDLLAVLLRNLLDNAVRYGDYGGRIEVGLSREAKNIVLRIADNGPGVSNEDHDKLGDRFQRFSTQAVDGVGLGLSIVRRIAELHGANLGFGPGLEGKGMGITLSLPATTGTALEKEKQ